MILLRNAIRRTNSGEIRFSACCDRVSLDSATIRCEVDDDGPPVPAACLNEPFGLNIADVSEGDELTTGLDFCIARRLAESMGGRFWIENKFTGGAISHLTATFLLREPVSRTTPLIPPQRILVAEDSEDNLFLVKALLRDVPCHLNTAENGAIAVEKACSGSFDLILMDVEMPVLDGYEATRRIRIWERDNNLPPIPIVALTARTLAEEADRSAQAGCSGYLPKPVRKRTLLDVIARHCTL